MDSVTAEIIMQGFDVIERSLVALRNEIRPNSEQLHITIAETDKAFEALRAFMHDGPDLEDDGTF